VLKSSSDMSNFRNSYKNWIDAGRPAGSRFSGPYVEDIWVSEDEDRVDGDSIDSPLSTISDGELTS